MHAFLDELNQFSSLSNTQSATPPQAKKTTLVTVHHQPSLFGHLDSNFRKPDNRWPLQKPTDRCQYLLTISCHQPHITENIPFSLAYRIVRICTDPTSRDKRLAELKDMLTSRDYKPNLIYEAIQKAKDIPRERALMRVNKRNDQINRRSVFSVEKLHSKNPQLIKNIRKPLYKEDEYFLQRNEQTTLRIASCRL